MEIMGMAELRSKLDMDGKYVKINEVREGVELPRLVERLELKETEGAEDSVFRGGTPDLAIRRLDGGKIIVFQRDGGSEVVPAQISNMVSQYNSLIDKRATLITNAKTKFQNKFRGKSFKARNVKYTIPRSDIRKMYRLGTRYNRKFLGNIFDLRINEGIRN